MKQSRRLSLLVLSAALAFGAAALPAAAQTDAAAASPLSKVKRGATVLSVVGEVTAVDTANRTVAIKGPAGNEETFKVSPDVKNFEQTKVGDRVRLTYRVAVAVALKKGGGGIRERVESSGGATAAPGQKPGGIAVEQTAIVADVVAVNTAKNFVTLKGADGKLVDVRVRDPKVMKEVKAGDQVEALITESVAVGVRPASQAPAK